MTLTFNSISLQNFGPYREVSELALGTSQDSPVVLIHGENTLGKSQLFSALRWCLYGTFQPQQTSEQANRVLHERLNERAREDGDDHLMVQLRFTANAQHHVLTRGASFTGTRPRVTADLRIDSTVVPTENIDGEIGKLLHPQISEFFMFDAELMRDFYDRLSTARERDYIRDRIESVLGIPALQRARVDVSELFADANARQQKATAGQSESARLNKKLKEYRDQAQSKERDQQDLLSRLTQAEGQLQETRDELKALEGLSADIRELETLEAQLSTDREAETTAREQMRVILGAAWMMPLASVLAAKLEEQEAENSLAKQRRNEVADVESRIKMLERQTSHGDCPTCGQTLPPPDEESMRALEEARKRLQEIGGKGGGDDIERERTIRRLVKRSEYTRYADFQTQVDTIAMRRYDRTRRISQIKDNLQGHSVAGIRALGLKEERLEDAVNQARREYERIPEQLKVINSNIDKTARQLDRLPGANPAVALESSFFSYVDTLFDRTIGRYRERTRSSVEQVASELLTSLIRDSARYGGLKIDGNYRVQLVDDQSRPVQTSEGGKQLVALSLIGALKLAAVRGGPVVIDSPLARLDIEHRRNVLTRWIPRLGSQTILLIQSGEMDKDQAHAILGSSIGREYEIRRPGRDNKHAEIVRL